MFKLGREGKGGGLSCIKTLNISQGVRINNYSRFHNIVDIHMEHAVLVEQC